MLWRCIIDALRGPQWHWVHYYRKFIYRQKITNGKDEKGHVNWSTDCTGTTSYPILHFNFLPTNDPPSSRSPGLPNSFLKQLFAGSTYFHGHWVDTPPRTGARSTQMVSDHDWKNRKKNIKLTAHTYDGEKRGETVEEIQKESTNLIEPSLRDPELRVPNSI